MPREYFVQIVICAREKVFTRERIGLRNLSNTLRSSYLEKGEGDTNSVIQAKENKEDTRMDGFEVGSY